MKRAARLVPGMRHAEKVKTLAAAWRQRSQLIGMLRSMFNGRYRASFLTRIALIFAIAYIVSPIDIIPDFLPVFGWGDDGLVFYLLLRRLLSEADRYQSVSAQSGSLYEKGNV